MTDAGKVIAAARDYAQIAAFMPILEAELSRLTTRTQADALRKLQEGLLTPELALQAWQEMAAILGVSRHFRSLAASGAASVGKS